MAELKPCPFCGIEMTAVQETQYRLPKDTDEESKIIEWHGRKAVPVVITNYIHKRNGCFGDAFCVRPCHVDAWNRRADNVVHGRWIEDRETGEIYCSLCGKTTNDMHDEICEFEGKKVVALRYPRFCGNCGARMEG